MLENMAPRGVDAEIILLSDCRLPVGLGFRESDDDDWPELATKLKAADIALFATPIWWGGRSSLMQRVIERMDASTRSTSLRVAARSTTRWRAW